MNMVKDKKALLAAKYRIALTIFILFLTGIRVGNLRTIYLWDLKQLYERKDFIVSAIKIKENKPLVFPPSKAFDVYLSKRNKDFETLFNAYQEDSLVFDYSREHLTRKINSYLKQASVILNKNLKSHSFRIGVATAVADKFSIYEAEAQSMLAHARISTTEKYVQSPLSK